MKVVLSLVLFLFNLAVFAYTPGDKVILITSKSCPACVEAKQELNKHNIPFIEKRPESKYWIVVPQLYVNGKFKGYGLEAVTTYANE